MVRRFLVALFALALSMSAYQARAATDASQSFTATRAASVPAVDGSVIDALWKSALQADNFFDVTRRTPSKLTTVAHLTYDDHNLYVAFRAPQTDVPLRATQTTNNVGFGADDFVGIGIDTSGNGARVLFFETTPLGTRYQQSSESSRFDPAWKASARIEKDGWTATMVIPIVALGGAGSAKAWRFNFVRNIAATNQHYSWAYDPLMFDSQPPDWPAARDARFWPALRGVAIASDSTRPKPQANVYALQSIGSERSQFPLANGVFGQQSPRIAGIDGVFPFTSTVRFVGTLDPDFSNVEVDQQTIAPQQFLRSLSEYRPFFARGAQYFHPNVFPGVIVPNEVIFYTPAIGPFNGGSKVEGTEGYNAFGVLDVNGRGFDNSAYGYKYRVPNGSFQLWSDGAIARDSLGVDKAAEIGTEVRNVKSGLITGLNAAREWKPGISNQSLAGMSDIFVDSQHQNFETYLGYREQGPFFAPRTGFTALNDFRGLEGYLNFTGAGAANTPFQSRGIFFTGDRFVDRSGAVREADFQVFGDAVFKTLFHIDAGQATSESRSYLSGYPYYTGGLTQWFNQSSLFLGYRESSDSPITASLSMGPFGEAYLQQYGTNVTRQIGKSTSILLGFGATRERFFAGGADGQYLRRLTWSKSLGPDSSLTLALRSISGNGGFATPGVNFAATFHNRFANKNDLYVSFGTPAASATLDRMIIKYVWRLGNVD